MRKTDTTRTLWVDAVCINQDDVVEKNHQVHLMKDIYGGATRVLVWLGEERHDTRAVWELFDLLEAGYQTRLERREQDLKDTSKWLGPRLNPLGKDLPPPSDPIWKSMRAFLDSPWFSRIWTYQESF